jgi:cytochrome c-type biogenesis protein
VQISYPLGIVFIAGVASFLSPCVLALVPAYVGYLSGRSAGVDSQTKNGRWFTFSHGLAFVLGFSLVFIFFGVAASALGKLVVWLGVAVSQGVNPGSSVDFVRSWLTRFGGLVVIVFGLHMIGILRIPFLEYDTRQQKIPDPKWGYLSSGLMGVFFSAGWSPCIGPVLGSIIMFVMNNGSIPQAVVMLSAYSAGLAVPFLLAALGIGWVTVILRKYSKVMRYTEIIMGGLMVIIGLMLFFEKLAIFANMFPGWSLGL